MRVASIQIGKARRLQAGGRTVLSAIGKQEVAGPVPVMPLGLLGDEQADLTVHGGLEKAVYACPAEHYAFWRQARQAAGVTSIDNRLPHGSLGENLTLEGLLETDVWAGDVLRFADCELQVRLPREPCGKLNIAMGYSGAVRAMAQSGFCGYYLSVLTPGSIQAGEAFTLVPGKRGTSIPQLLAAKMSKHLRGT